MNNIVLFVAVLACAIICCIEAAPAVCNLPDKRAVIGDIYSGELRMKSHDSEFPLHALICSYLIILLLISKDNN